MDLDAVIEEMDRMLDEADVRPRRGPVVGGRWTLYDGELPIGAWGSVCAITGKPPSPGVRFVDIGFTVENDTPNGDVCLCEEYVAELGAAIGMVPALEHERALAELEELRAEVEGLRDSAADAPGVSVAADPEVLAALSRIEGELARRKGGRPKKETASGKNQEG